MPSLSSFTDSTAVKHSYARKVFVYVESDSDVNLFSTIVGTKFHQYIQFATPPEKGNGCGPAKDFVAKYRKDDSHVYALLDGEAAVAEKDGFARFVASDATIFTLEQPDGVLFLADHEAENILFRQSQIVAYIADQATLAQLGKKKPEEIAQKLSAIVDRQFEGALCKYASYLLHAAQKMNGVLSGTHADNRPDDETLALIMERVANAMCDWKTFNTELDKVRNHIVLHLNTMDEAGRITTVWRLADGKIALKHMRNAYGIAPTWEVPLARQVASSDYAVRFRKDLFELTNISVAA